MSTANQGILLVCMGNICRSPTAEAILRAQLRARGLEHAADQRGGADRHGARSRRHADRLASIGITECVGRAGGS